MVSIFPVAALRFRACSRWQEKNVERHYSLVVERQPCKLKVLGSIPSGGFSWKGVSLFTRCWVPRGKSEFD